MRSERDHLAAVQKPMAAVANSDSDSMEVLDMTTLLLDVVNANQSARAITLLKRRLKFNSASPDPFPAYTKQPMKKARANSDSSEPEKASSSAPTVVRQVHINGEFKDEPEAFQRLLQAASPFMCTCLTTVGAARAGLLWL